MAVFFAKEYKKKKGKVFPTLLLITLKKEVFNKYFPDNTPETSKTEVNYDILMSKDYMFVPITSTIEEKITKNKFKTVDEMAFSFADKYEKQNGIELPEDIRLIIRDDVFKKYFTLRSKL